MTLFEYLESKPYPGRGIFVGKTRSGKQISAYFIMGRSVNSRNRVFEKTDDGIRTRAFDESKMTDPSLIIYHPVRKILNALIITNGDQTDTIKDYVNQGDTWLSALKSREFEPDEPNYTPRISAIIEEKGYLLSILKSANGDPKSCQRFFYLYENPIAGSGHFISTYEGGGDPIPSFSGEPLEFSLDDESEDIAQFSERLWTALDAENKVSLYVNLGGESIIINKNQ